MNKCTILSVMNRHNFGKFFFPFLFIIFFFASSFPLFHMKMKKCTILSVRNRYH